jgi:hypothetical protein
MIGAAAHCPINNSIKNPHHRFDEAYAAGRAIWSRDPRVGATAVGLKLVARTVDRPVDVRDWLAGAIYLLTLCVPLRAVSLAAVTFLAIYESVRHFR